MSDQNERDEIDLGDGHRMIFTSYKGEKRVGANVAHPPVEGKCGGESFVVFEGRAWAQTFEGGIATWKVEADEPITLSPSLLCRACGDHGFVRNGQWVRA